MIADRGVHPESRATATESSLEVPLTQELHRTAQGLRLARTRRELIEQLLAVATEAEVLAESLMRRSAADAAGVPYSSIDSVSADLNSGTATAIMRRAATRTPSGGDAREPASREAVEHTEKT